MMVMPCGSVPTAKARQKTISRRNKAISHFREVVTSSSQLVHEVQRLGKEERQKLLRSQGITLDIPVEAGLAMKSDLSLPWATLRIIRRYMLML